MKICLLSRYFDFTNAGLGRIATEVADELERRGHTVARVAANADTLSGYAYKVLWGIRRQIPKGYDVYHALSPMEMLHTPWHRTVVSFNDLIPMTHPQLAGAGLQQSRWHRGIGTWFFASFSRYAVLKARRIVTISNHVANEMPKAGLPVRPQDITVVRLGINPALVPHERREHPFTVGYLGQLDHRKRVHLLLEAFIGSGREGVCRIAGTGPEAERLRALAEDVMPGQRVEFLGRLAEEELPLFYNSLDLLVFPTMIEGYGLPPVEAMACRVPTVLLTDAIVPFDVARRCDRTPDLIGYLEERVYERFGVRQLDNNMHWAHAHRWSDTVDTLLKVYEEIA